MTCISNLLLRTTYVRRIDLVLLHFVITSDQTRYATVPNFQWFRTKNSKNGLISFLGVLSSPSAQPRSPLNMVIHYPHPGSLGHGPNATGSPQRKTPGQDDLSDDDLEDDDEEITVDDEAEIQQQQHRYFLTLMWLAFPSVVKFIPSHFLSRWDIRIIMY